MMLRKPATKNETGKVVAMEQAQEKFVYVFSPRSGRKYKWYYKRFMKKVAKLTLGYIAAVIIGGFMLNAALEASDKEHEMRMQRQKEYFESIKKFNPEPMDSDTFELIYGERGDK